jgi:lysozyme
VSSAAAGKRGVRLYRPIPTEPWHIDPDAGDLRRYYLKARRHERLVKARKAAAKARKAAAKVKPATRTSSKGVEFIAGFEGCVLHPYQDAVGVWTIGYGHTAGVTAHPAPEGPVPTRCGCSSSTSPASTSRPSRPRSSATGSSRRRASSTPPSPPSTTSARGSWRGPLVRRGAVPGDDLQGAADALLLYVKAGNQTLPGLVTRRKAERARFLSK